MHFCTLQVFLQITCSLHERNLMNSFEMRPEGTYSSNSFEVHPEDLFVRKDRPPGSWVGMHDASHQTWGQKLPPHPGNQSPNTQ